MRAVSLFSSVGGLDLGLHRAGIHTVYQCELDPWRRSVLEAWWPGIERTDDVRNGGVQDRREGQRPARGNDAKA